MSYTFKYNNLVISEQSSSDLKHSQLDLDDGTNPHGTTASDVGSPSGSGTSTGTNTGDETTSSIQTKRPLKTVNGVSIEGSGDATIEDNTKEPAIASGTVSQYFRGDKSWQTLDKTAVGLSNVDNTSDVDKPVSTAQSTAIGLKENSSNKSTSTADSASSIKFPVWSAIVSYFSVSQIKSILDITTLSGSNTGDEQFYFVQSTSSSPVDAQTVYFGNLPKGLVTTAGISKVYIKKTGTISAAEIYCYSGTAGTAENWSMYIRVNNTTDYLIKTVGSATNERRFNNDSLSISVTAGDYFEIKLVNPTWATNPLTTTFGGNVIVR